MSNIVIHVKRQPQQSREEVQPIFTSSTGLLQLCSEQDCTPCLNYDQDIIAMFVGDGHGGHHCASIIDSHAQKILTEIITNGPEVAMAVVDELCKVASDGAMLTLLHYDTGTRIMTIVNRGDCSCIVYQNGSVIHSQRHHSYEVVESDQELLQQANGLGIHLNKVFAANGVTMLPDKDGKTMHVKIGPTYFRWERNLSCIQAASFVGHNTIARLPPFVSRLELPDGPFRVCMSSDGLSDVINTEDSIMKETNADDMVEEAYKRWCTPFFDASIEPRLARNNVDGHLVLNPCPTTTRDGRRHNKGADDISVIVLDVHA